MRAKVLKDPALAKHAGRFAWLSIDGEDAANAVFTERVGIGGYPTFYVIDAATEQVALRWYGSLTAAQFERLLDDGERAAAGAGSSPAEEALARADRLGGGGDPAEAARAYAEALSRAPAGWPSRGRTVESMLYALRKAGDLEGCAAAAQREVPGLERGPSFANAAAAGIACALEGPAGAPWRAGALRALEPFVKESLVLESVLADDRSGCYEMLVEAAKERGDKIAEREFAEGWLRFLEGESGKAPDPETRAAFDSHRVAAALALGDPGRAVPALLASERDLPDDYNPPARLAILYREMGRYDEALAASARALSMAYGPRKLRLYDTRADVFVRKGDAAAARSTIEEALRYADSLPASQRPARLVDQLKQKLVSAGG